MTGCPPRELLLGLVRGELEAARAGRVEAHLEQCPACQAALDGIEETPGLSLLQRLRPAHGGTAEAALPPARSPQYIGKLGEFDIETKLGGGGMGTVYRAYDSRLRRRVAVKVVRPELAVVGGFRERFEREARAAAAVKSAHAVPIHAVHAGADGFPFPFLVMELVEGLSLRSRLDRDQQIPQREAAQIALEVARGLAAVHGAGLIHRDVKPANILLEAREGHALLTDFGVARPTGDDEEALTRTGVAVGTPSYMSPEQIEAGEIDERSDLFSLGIVLYEMLTGSRPYRGATPHDIAHRMRNYPPPSARAANRLVSADLDTICAVCLGNEPDDRFDSAADLAADLERFLAKEPIACRKPGITRRMALFTRRNPLLTWTTAVFSAILLAYGTWSLLALATARSLTRTAEEGLTKAKTEVVDKTRIADEKSRIATEKTKLAETKATEAELRKQLEYRTRYFADMRNAWRAWNDNRPSEMRVILDRYAVPPSDGLPDLRGAEWHYMNGLLASGFRSLDFEGPARSARLSPDGSHVAAVGTNGRGDPCVALWELAGNKAPTRWSMGRATGNMEHQAPAPITGDQGVCFSPDGRYLAATCTILHPDRRDGIVNVWEVASGAAVFQKTDAGIGGRAVTFSPDGKHVIAGGFDLAAFAWEFPSGELRWTLSAYDPRSDARRREPPRPGLDAGTASPVDHLLFGINGARMARSTATNRARGAWPPTQSGRELGRSGSSVGEDLFERLSADQELAFSPTFGWALAKSSTPDAVRVYHPDSPSRLGVPTDATPSKPSIVATFKTDAGAIRSVALTPFGIALGQDDGRLTYFVIDPNQGHVQKRFLLRGHEGSIHSLACDQEGKRVIAAGNESVTIWEVSMPPEMQPLAAALGTRRDWVWDHGRPLRLPHVTAASGPFEVTDPKTNGEAIRFALPVERLAAFTFDERLLQCAVSGDDRGHEGVVYVLRPGSGAPLALRGHRGHVFSLMFEPGGKRLLSAAQDGTVRLWDTQAGREIKQFIGLRLPVRNAEFSPDGKYVVAAGDDPMVHVWNADSAALVDTLPRAMGQDAQWAFHEGLLALPVAGNKLIVRDLAARQTVAELDTLGKTIASIAFIDGGSRLVSTGDHAITLWSVDQRDEILTLPWGGGVMPSAQLMADCPEDLAGEADSAN